MATEAELAAARKSTADTLNKLKSEFVSKLDSVQSFINNYTQYGGVNDAGHDPVDIVIKSLDAVQLTLDKIVFNAPARPAGLDAIQPEKYNTHIWHAWQIDGLEDQLMQIVNTSDTGVLKELSGVGVPIGLQESMYNYQRDIDQQDLEYSLDKLDAQWAQDGYVLPPDALIHNRAWEIERYNQKRTDRTRNIYSEITKLAQQNVQWAYENGIKIEMLHSDFAIKYSQIFKDVIEAIVALYKADVDIAIAEMEGHIKKLQAEIEVAKLNIDHDSKEMELKVSQANSRFGTWVTAYDASIAANTQTTAQRIGAATNVAEGYKGILTAAATQYADLNVNVGKGK